MVLMKCLLLMLFITPVACLLAQTPPSPKTAEQQVTAGQPVPADKPAAPDKVVLTIGGEKITAAQMDHLMDLLPPQYRSRMRTSGRREFAESLVRVTVLAQEARRRKLDQTAAYKDQLAFEGEKLLAQTLEQNLLTTKVDGAAMRAYYDQHKCEFTDIKASHILIRYRAAAAPAKPGEKELTEAQALAKAQEIHQELLGGGKVTTLATHTTFYADGTTRKEPLHRANFSELAMTYSDDTATASQGGELGLIAHGRTDPAFEKAACALQPGEISEPVKTASGYDIIKLEEKHETPLEEVKPQLQKSLAFHLWAKMLVQLQSETPVVMDPEYFGPAPQTPMPAVPAPAPHMK
jgi:peptidyl-prolyl cis-trans isomerase C